MYAEQFNAPSWLEGPSQWLWWAMQSRIAGNLKDAQWNLVQFWKELETTKASADESTWPEILALDSQSHIQAANITGAIITEMEKDLSSAVAWANFISPNIMSSYIGDAKSSASVAIKKMQDQRLMELQTASQLADQANSAFSDRVAAVADGRISSEDAERAMENTQLQRIIHRDDSSGVPWWAYLVGAVGLMFVFRGK